ARTAALLSDAERAGAKSIRLFLGKPSSARLSELCQTLVERGPFHFPTSVGLWLCRVPGDDDLDAIERAFDGSIHVSLIPPDEHVPALGPGVLAAERAALRHLAARVANSKKLWLDVWVMDGRDAEALRTDINAGPRVKVSSGAVWSMTRPGDGATTTLARVREATAHVWTFYAARLLSPALARLLAPFRFLDEVADDLDALDPPSAPELVPFHTAILRAWKMHRLPTIEGLAFDAVPVALSAPATRRAAEGTRYAGDLTVAVLSTVRPVGPAIALVEHIDHRGVRLEAQIPALPAGCDALALVPRGDGPSTPAWLEAMSRSGLAVMRAPPDARSCVLRIDLRVQDARAFLLEAEGEPLRRGVADVGYFSAPKVPK
ncbi:MAG: hypothetical protein WCJ30_06360, partial [Deltaproteobacteria bacterium]